MLGIGLMTAILVAGAAAVAARLARRRGVAPVRHDEIDLAQSRRIMSELEATWSRVRRDLGAQQAAIGEFKKKIERLREHASEVDVQQLSQEAEQLLAGESNAHRHLLEACDQIRQQSDRLQKLSPSPSQLRSDSQPHSEPLGQSATVHETQVVGEVLHQMLPLQSSGHSFSVAVLSLEPTDPSDATTGMQALRLARECLGDEPITIPHGQRDLLIVFPQAGIDQAVEMIARIREEATSQLPVALAAGVAELRAGDTQSSLLARADAALYTARTAQGNAIYRHDGIRIETASSWSGVRTAPRSLAAQRALSRAQTGKA